MKAQGKYISSANRINSIIRVSIFSAAILFSTTVLLTAQSPDLSGITNVAGVNGEEYNSIAIKFENNINADQGTKISNDLLKYNGVSSVNFSSVGDYVYIKYKNTITPNQLLAVLDRINLRGHYLVSGSPVYYQKDDSIYFIR